MQRRLDAGLCLGCGDEPAKSGRRHGEDCLKKARDLQTAFRDSRLCPRCARAPGWKAGYCQDCYPKFVANKKTNEAARIAEGKCERCTRKRSTRSKRLCDRCLDKKYENEREREARSA